MRHFLRIGFFAVVFTFVFGTLAATETSAQRTTEVLRRLDERYKKMQTLKSDITMEKRNNQLDETDVSVGKVKYIPKTGKRVMYIRIDWEKPAPESMAVIGDKYVIYRPQQQQVYEGSASKAKNNAKAGNALAFLSMSRKEMNDNYTYRDLGVETLKDGTKAVHLELTPKTSTTYKMAHLWIDKDGVPVMARIVEKNNDTTTILLSNLKMNDSINGGDFVIDYPKSIKPIK